jgi:uncharacterized SAM-binding protein YcdF (DUF218 family)
MPISYLFQQLVLPPGGLLLLLIAAGWLRYRFPRVAVLCFALGLGGLWLMSLPVVVQGTARLLEREPAIPLAQWATLGERAQAIVVLGAGRARDPAWGADQPGYVALERLRYAARLGKVSGLPILVSGGMHHGQPPSEAAIAADVLQHDFAMPIRWLEERSRTTWENAVYSAELLKAEGIDRILLVTSAAHMARARWSFEQNGVAVIAAPVGFMSVPNGRPLGGWLPEARAIWRSGMLLNEIAGMTMYRLKQWQK